MKKLLLGTVALVLLGSPAAWAADPLVAMADAPVASWTGFYVGALAGADFQSSKVDIPDYPSSFTINKTGFNFGAKAGYNYQFAGPWVVGVEGSFAGNWNHGKHLSGNGGSEQFEVKSNWNGAVVAKAGYAFDNFLIYGKGGLAVANFDRLSYIPPGGGGPKSRTYTGWALGAGVDYAVTANWIVGVDYTYTSFNNKDFIYSGPTNVKPRASILNASVSYKF